MNRELRFRAWYKYQKQMKEVFSLDFVNRKAYIEINKFQVPFGYIHFDDCELMQYTGVKDNTEEETEIYEGDNIKFMYNDIEFIGEVKFEGGCFILCNYDLPDSYIPLLEIIDSDREYFFIDGEVVSNIYEKQLNNI